MQGSCKWWVYDAFLCKCSKLTIQDSDSCQHFCSPGNKYANLFLLILCKNCNPDIEMNGKTKEFLAIVLHAEGKLGKLKLQHNFFFPFDKGATVTDNERDFNNGKEKLSTFFSVNNSNIFHSIWLNDFRFTTIHSLIPFQIFSLFSANHITFGIWHLAFGIRESIDLICNQLYKHRFNGTHSITNIERKVLRRT